MMRKLTKQSTGDQLSFGVEPQPCQTDTRHLVISRSSVTTTEVFDTYWHFAAERQNLFFRRARGCTPPWTSDPIFLRFRFTNVYRVADRVSQFLVRHVQADGPQDHRSLFFRTILFKLFNRIDTWQLLESVVGPIHPETYDYSAFDRVLSNAMTQGRRIYSAAYIMPSGGVEGSRKHQMHLRLLESMMKDDLPSRLSDSRSMQEAFELIRSYPTIGDFLAYQYVTDLNYSGLLDFSEMEFVTAGPGARSGIQKCFADRGSYSEPDLIRWMAEHQHEEFSRRGIEFQTLWGRPLQLIDCQNLFCEVDKYARVHHPDVCGLSSRVRIKQEYRYNAAPLEYWLPPKWALNDRIAAWRQSYLAKVELAPTAIRATEGA
jgi:hypothetical protein